MITVNTNIDELIEKFKKLQSEIGAIDFSSALLVGVNAALGKMSFRIFNQGLDADGIDFGKYTGKKKGIRSKKLAKKIKKIILTGAESFDDGLTDYEKLRIGKGRQIGYKDLEFTGDLRRGIVVGVESKTLVICWIPNDELFKIANYQEEQIGNIRGGDPIRIFTLSDSERQLMNENIVEALKQIYDRLLTNT